MSGKRFKKAEDAEKSVMEVFFDVSLMFKFSVDKTKQYFSREKEILINRSRCMGKE